GQAQDPLDEAPLYLRVGSGHADHPNSDSDTIAQSPAAAEFNIYDIAYREEVARIRGLSEGALVYLTRRVSAWDSPKTAAGMGHEAGGRAAPGSGATADPTTADHAAVSDPSTTTADGGGTPDDAKSATPSTAPQGANQTPRETHEA
ncbi:hypothetical protein V493_07650, partial [Pseudogymnoascus sp. VKM F-4281 (FW-2241)]